MPEEISILSSLFVQTGEGLDNIISILRRGVEPPSPITKAYYSDGSVVEYNIVGDLNQNAIPSKRNVYNLTKVEIGTDVERVWSNAFYNYSGLTSITIPDSVIRIGGNAFSGCSGLTSITIPDSVITIGGSAFFNCSGLTSVTIGNSVSSIGSNVFEKCSGLTSVTIGNSVSSIGNYAFEYCSNLSSIICQATTAPTVQSKTFGNNGNSSSYTGRSSYSTGDNVLKVPQGATGYETTGTAWKDTLQSTSMCGFHIEYI